MEFQRQTIAFDIWSLMFWCFGVRCFGLPHREEFGPPDREDGADKVVGRGFEARLFAVGW